MYRTALVHGVDRGGGRGVTADSRDAEFAAYMHARQRALLRTAFLLTGNAHTAEDVVATALAKLYLAWDKVRDRESIDGYVRRIIANETTSLWRRPWKRREVAAEVLPEHGREDSYDDGRAAAVWQAVSSLPPRQRAVVVLSYYEDLSDGQVAEALGCSTGTVKSQRAKALRSLRARIDQEGQP